MLTHSRLTYGKSSSQSRWSLFWNHRPFFSTEPLSVEPTADVRDRILVEASVKVAGDVADMRRCQQVRQRAERMVERQRLLVEDIDGCASDLFVLKRRNEIGLDDDRSTRSIYQARRRLHE